MSLKHVLTVAAIMAFGSMASAGDLGIPHDFDFTAYKREVIGVESAGSGTYSALNSTSGAAGAYQFMPVAIVDIGYGSYTGGGRGWSGVTWTSLASPVSSLDSFLANPGVQDRAIADFTKLLWRRMASSGGVMSEIGKTINGVPITEGGMISAAHFLGAGGAASFVRAGYTCAGIGNLTAILRQNGFSSVADCTQHVMKRFEIGARAHGETSSAVASVGTQCQQVAIMDPAGEAISSPFGVDRTGRASAGFHAGLDMVNARGDRTELKAGIDGTIGSSIGAGMNSFQIISNDGLQKFGYLHNRVVKVRANEKVTADQVVSIMGSKGSGNAVHLHLAAFLRGDVVQAAADDLGRVFAVGGMGYGDKSAYLSAQKVAELGSESTYFVVNPERFLHHRVKFQPGILAAYASQGLDRPDGLTLEPTCGPTAEDLADNGVMASSNGGTTADGGMSMTGTGMAVSEQVSMAMATEEGRDAVIEYGTAIVGQIERRRAAMQGEAMRSSLWAGMNLTAMRN